MLATGWRLRLPCVFAVWHEAGNSRRGTRSRRIQMALQEPKLYTLNEVLHDRLFQVPPYQRGYSWTAKERGALFQDLRNLRNLHRDEHFMATLVFRDTGKQVRTGG